MNDAYYTETGERPSLAALEVNAPEGYIGAKIAPVAPVVDKAGTVYYATVTADATAQTGRAAGAAPASTQISDTSTTYTAAEAVKRGSITPDEVKQMGGITKADPIGAKWAKRQVMNAQEAVVAGIVTGGTADYTWDAAEAMSQIQVAVQAVRLYSGKLSMIASTAVLKIVVQNLLANSTFGPSFSRLIAGGSPAQAAEGMNFAAWLNGLAMFFGLDQILAGDDTVWNAGSNAEKFAIAKIDSDMDPLSHKWNPVFCKTFQFMPDGENPWVIQSVADRVNVNNHYDAYLWYNVVELNSGAMKLFDGVSTS